MEAIALVVFFSAVSVDGHQRFLPGKLASELERFGVINIGAAETFVLRQWASKAKLRDEILRRLPFEPELIICPAREPACAGARGTLSWCAQRERPNPIRYCDTQAARHATASMMPS